MLEKLWLKMTAIFLSYVTVAVFVLSTFATAVMGYYKFYFSSKDTVKAEVLEDLAADEALYAADLFESDVNLTKYYRDKNVRYEAEDIETGEIIESNYNNEEYIAFSEMTDYEWIAREQTDDFGNVYQVSEPVPKATVKIYIPQKMEKSDIFSVTASLVEFGYPLKYGMIFIAVISLALSIVLLCYLFCAAGHVKGGEIKCNAFDKLPFDILFATVAVCIMLGLIGVYEMRFNDPLTIILLFIVGSVGYFLGLGTMLSFATRIKTGTLLKNTLIYKILKFLFGCIKKLWKFAKNVISGIPFVIKWILLFAAFLVFCLFSAFFVFFIFEYMSEFLGGLLICGAVAALIAAVVYVLVILGRIKAGSEKISSGDLEYKINTDYMFGDFKSFAESLNNISNGLQSNINERMKSERFKTVLITNVSHDIKTPLTSIINYVDLIKREKTDNETISNYVDVLYRQSSRLKKLVEDLVEASKASTGNLPVNLTECDITVLLSQTIAEFEENLQKSELIPVLNVCDGGVKVLADGRHLWRVFDNLMNNVCKYALPGTRVYIDVKKENGKATVTFRNISKYQLNISADELMERFVRGDSSRNTEGSGLGLSIARSLAELQGGRLDLAVDGDLFKAAVIFDAIK